MLTALAILGVLAVLFLVFSLAANDGQGLAPVSPDAADLALPEHGLGADDVRGLRFGLAARGYRMSEVDAALARLAGELEARDARIAELSAPVADSWAPPVVADVAAEPVVAAPVVVTPPVVDPDAAGEAGAAAVDGVDLAEASPLQDVPARPAAVSFPMDFPEVQSADAPEDDAVPGAHSAQP